MSAQVRLYYNAGLLWITQAEPAVQQSLLETQILSPFKTRFMNASGKTEEIDKLNWWLFKY